MPKMNFPSWLYHKSLGAKLIESEKDFKELGKGWIDSPAEFELVSVVKKDKRGKESVAFEKPEEE